MTTGPLGNGLGAGVGMALGHASPEGIFVFRAHR